MEYLKRAASFLVSFSLLSLILIPYPRILFFPDYRNIVEYNWLDPVIVQAESFYREGRFEEALKAFLNASAVAEYKGEARKYIGSKYKAGLCYWNLGRTEDSKLEYLRLLKTASGKNLKKEQIEVKKILDVLGLYKLGIELREARDFEKSLHAFQEAIEIADKASKKELKQRIYRQVSIIYWDMNDLKNFYHFNNLSLKLAEQMHHKAEVGKCLNNIGIFYRKSFEYSRALSVYTRALEISRDLGKEKEESNILHNLGLVYKDFGYYDRALDHLKQALEIDIKTERSVYFPIDYINIGIIYKLKAEQENNSELLHRALDYFTQSLSLAESQQNKVVKLKSLNNLGSSLIEMNEFSKALPYLERSLHLAHEIKDYESISMILNNMGYVYLGLQDYEEAENLFKQAVTTAQKKQLYNTLWEAYFGLGKIKEKTGSFQEAGRSYGSSIEAVEKAKQSIVLDLHNAGFVQSKLKVYESLMDLFYSLHKNDSLRGYGEKMFQVAERAKAQVLIKNLENIRIKNKAKIGQDKEDPRAYQLNEIQNYLEKNRAVIFEYFLGEKRSYLFVVTPQDLKIFPLPSKTHIAKSIQGYLKLLKGPAQGEFKGVMASQRIYKELLSPLSSLDPGSLENLIIIPSGVLYYLPFETLIAPEHPNAFLITRYKISYIPSCVSLLYLSLNRKERIYPKDLLAFGNPFIKEKIRNNESSPSSILIQLYKNQNFEFSSLPYSEKEIKSISKLFDQKKQDIFLREDASEEKLKQNQLLDYKVIHFSCHGFLDKNYPSRSSLVLSLSEGGQEDGFLQVQEIQALPMEPKLVVLSACQTGRGALTRGEGVLGLPRVFFYSGAESVLSSLWRVRDKQTAEFMKLFYQYLASGKSKSHSLQLAKIEFIKSKKYSNPFYWAPFVLSGEFKSDINF